MSAYGPKTILESTHVVEQLLYSMFPSILTFDFDLILGLILTFWGPDRLFLGLTKGSKTVLMYLLTVKLINTLKTPKSLIKYCL